MQKEPFFGSGPVVACARIEVIHYTEFYAPCMKNLPYL
jgi:hypothetical protein